LVLERKPKNFRKREIEKLVESSTITKMVFPKPIGKTIVV
jgi:hypothetical protein